LAATSVALEPIFQEGKIFWDQFVLECQKYMQTFNGTVALYGAGKEQLVNCASGPELQMAKHGHPSTQISAALKFCPWGPMICGTITGQQDEQRRFSPEEFEFQIAKDLDGETIAIYDEGKSFSAHDLASYLVQSFHRCYPGVALPY
jgi:hypothetical protein